MAVPNPLFQNTEEQIRLVKHEINDIIKERAQGAMIRSKMKWCNEGEKPTKYFLNLEKHNYHHKTLHRLQLDSGKILEQAPSVLNEIRNYCDNLYKSRGEINEKYLEKLQIPKITQEQKEMLDSELTSIEIGKALKNMKLNTSPGTDGLTTNFYKKNLAQNKGDLCGCDHSNN